MQCTDCKLQGISCPYTYMVVPSGQVPDPCLTKLEWICRKVFLIPPFQDICKLLTLNGILKRLKRN